MKRTPFTACGPRHAATLLLSASTLLMSATAQAQDAPREVNPPSLIALDTADNQSLMRLQRFDALLANGQLPEAIEVLRQVLDEDDGKVVPLSAPRQQRFRRYVTLREYCQFKLVALAENSPVALQLYRQQVDPTAARLFKRAIADNDEALLRRVADRFFASSYGDDAVLRLGEMALERGHWTAARGYWQRLSPNSRFPTHRQPALRAVAGYPLWLLTRHLESDNEWQPALALLQTADDLPEWLVYPDSDLDAAGVHARLTLVSILQGNHARAAVELELLARLWPTARGRIAGRDGNYAELLADLLADSRSWPDPTAAAEWTTFGGNASRVQRARRGVDISLEPLWQIDLQRYAAEGEFFGQDGRRVAESAAGLLSFHPLVINQMVVLQTGVAERDFVAYRLDTGERLFGATPDGESGAALPRAERIVGVPRFTTTAIGNTLYARAGSPITGDRRRDESSKLRPSKLVAIDLSLEGKLVLDLELAGSAWGPDWSFDGVPVSDGPFLYTVVRKRGTARAEAHVACFAARDGRLVWRRMLAGGEVAGDRPYEITNTLLTLQDDTLYCNTNLGVVAALHTVDGGVRWLTEYPRADWRDESPDRDTRHHFRDLNPCLPHDDLLIVAPQDCNRIFALDALTGRKIWETAAEQAVDAVHLLGVGQEQLLVSGDYLYWFDVHTGQLAGQFPAPRKSTAGHALPSPRGYGRGILAGKHVYWPSRESIFVFEQRTAKTRSGGRPVLVRRIPLVPRGATGGNLVLADGVLLMATPDKLFAFDEHGKTSRVTE